MSEKSEKAESSISCSAIYSDFFLLLIKLRIYLNENAIPSAFRSETLSEAIVAF